MSPISQNPRAEHIPKIYEEPKILMTSSQVFAVYYLSSLTPPFPKTCCSEFYVLWSSVNQSSMITDSLYMGQLESLWHDFKIPKSIKLMWFETINPFFFPPPQAVSSLKWCQTDCKILGQVSWDHGLNVPSYKSDQGVEGHISSSTGQENRH